MPVLSTLTGGTRRCHEQALGSVEMCGASLFAKNNASNSICSTCVKRRLSRPRLSGKKYDHLLHDVISIGGVLGYLPARVTAYLGIDLRLLGLPGLLLLSLHQGGPISANMSLSVGYRLSDNLGTGGIEPNTFNHSPVQ